MGARLCLAAHLWTPGTVRVVNLGKAAFVVCVYSEQLTQNWSGQGESDCLIKTKHCDGRKRC